MSSERGPNGLSAAIVLAQAGKSVLVVEAKDAVGGGMRSAELTLPGFVHDVCSTAYPLGVGSPIFNSLPLAEHGLEWVHPTAPVSHPFDDGTTAVLYRSVTETADALDSDAEAYRKLMRPLVTGLGWSCRLPAVSISECTRASLFHGALRSDRNSVGRIGGSEQV